MPESPERFASPQENVALTPVWPELASFAAALAEQYVIERPLGEGGMASVFLAQDRKHGRRVAVKVVHPDLSATLGRERFLAEIRTTARLQHPHILPLLDSGDAGGLLYYVMPHVDGDSLRDRLNREKQLAIEDALRIANEVADALGYAHQHGIIHRDIKPENILLQGGHALVADFGIALAVQHAGGQRLTQTGLSLGTPQYMSPEQAMGERTIDARSDVYALGAVTYEMLTGEPPFTGASTQAVVAKVLTERPTPPMVVRDSVPPHVEHAVLKALAKLPADRWPTTQRFAEALQRDAAASFATGHAAPARSADQRGLPFHLARNRRLGAVAMIVVLAAAISWWLGRRSTRPEPPWSEFTQLTDASGVETSPSLSPDGESFAYASNARGTWDIYVQRVGGRNPVVVSGDSTNELWPAYSPDGKEIAFAKRGLGIYVMGATGESARRITTFGSNPAWSPDGRSIVFGSEEVISPYAVYSSGTLWVVESTGGTPRRLDITRESGTSGRDGSAAEEAPSVYQPAWSPSGARIAFWAVTPGGRRDLMTVAAAGGSPLKVTDDAALDWAPVWSLDGRFLYLSSDRGGSMGIWRIRVDEASGRARGEPELVAAGADGALDLPRLSRDGRALLFRSSLESANPAAVPFDAANARIGPATLLQHRTGVLLVTDVSPDDQWLTGFNFQERQEDIFIIRRDGSGLTRLTNDAARDRNPRFTPDGKGVTFFSNLGGIANQGWSINLDGSGRIRLTDIPGGTQSTMFAPDGKRIMASNSQGGGARPLWIGTEPWPITEKTATIIEKLNVPGGVLIPTFWTRDGRRLSGYVLTPSGEVLGHGVYEFATQRAWRVNDDSHSRYLAWLPDNRHVVYFTTRGKLVIQDVETLARRDVSGTLPYPSLTPHTVTLSRDGRTLYYSAARSDANIWMVGRASP